MQIEFTKEQLKISLKKTADTISSHYSNITENPLLVIPILNGGVFFYVDLVRRLTIKTEMGIISTNLYGEAEIPFENVIVRYQDANVYNKDVLLIDEICFSGKTLKAVKELFIQQGAKSVKTAVLVNHIRPNRVHCPDWFVVNYTGDAWLFGYGMDLEGLYREKEDILR